MSKEGSEAENEEDYTISLINEYEKRWENRLYGGSGK